MEVFDDVGLASCRFLWSSLGFVSGLVVEAEVPETLTPRKTTRNWHQTVG
jgi:hypothetical protein